MVFLHKAGPPRRDPYPYDILAGGVGYMLGYGQDAGTGKPSKQLIGTKPPTQDQTAPSDFKYSAQNPIFERIQPYDKMALGYGLRLQSGFQDQRYYYALNADLSVEGLWLKGPNVVSFTPATTDATNGATKFFELGGVLYLVAGRYVLQRVNDTSWTVSKDFGAGKAALDAIVFYSNALSTSYAFVGLGDNDNFYYFDGTTWTQAVGAGMTARAFAVAGREFYRATSGNTLAKCSTDADPTNVNNWGASNQFHAGDKTSNIQRLVVTATGALLVVKTDGVYSIDGAGEDHNLFPNLRFAADSQSGLDAGLFLNDVYVTYREGTYRIKTQITLGRPHFLIEEVGPERATSNDSPVRGKLTSFLGHDTFHAYAGLYNEDTGNSYLLKYGAWIGGAEGKAPEAERKEVWHGSITPAFSGVKIATLYKSTVGAPTNYSRLYLGFSDGTLAQFVLPNTPNPAACSVAAGGQYQFATADGFVYLPTFTGDFINDQKSLRAVTITGLNISSTNYAQVQYRTDPLGSYTTLATNFNVDPLTKVNFPNNVAGSFADLVVVLKSTSTNSCPQLTGMGLHHAVRPRLYQVYEFDVLAFDGLVKRNGVPYRTLGSNEIRSNIETLADTAGSVTVVFPDEVSKQLSFVGYRQSQAWDERLRRWGASLHCEAAEYVTNVTAGTWDRVLALNWDAIKSGQTWDTIKGL